MNGAQGFAAAARAENNARVAAILEHAFCTELAAGTLEPGRFSYYIAQDAHYLGAFARALTLASGRAPSGAAQRLLLRLAGEGVDGERALHESFGVDASVPAGPACAAYGDYLIATAATGTFGELLAALLPCYDVYAEIAGAIAENAAPGNRYARWIEAYDGESFAKNVRAMVALVDEAAAVASADERAAMLAAYSRSVIHEWSFFDAAYAMRAWPL